jgi:transcriptional regulator with XRE-family HTH domain
VQRVQFTLKRCRGKEFLRKTGLTQQEIADMTGYTKQEISDWFRNRKPINLNAAYTIAYVFNCSIEDLCEFSSREPPDSRRSKD